MNRFDIIALNCIVYMVSCNSCDLSNNTHNIEIRCVARLIGG
jgi:hypothetical protein